MGTSCNSDGDDVARIMWLMTKLNDWRNEFFAESCGVKLRRTKYELSSMGCPCAKGFRIIVLNSVYFRSLVDLENKSSAILSLVNIYRQSAWCRV